MEPGGWNPYAAPSATCASRPDPQVQISHWTSHRRVGLHMCALGTVALLVSLVAASRFFMMPRPMSMVVAGLGFWCLVGFPGVVLGVVAELRIERAQRAILREGNETGSP